LRKYIEHCEKCIAAFLRGFADAEGSVDKNGRIIMVTTCQLAARGLSGLSGQRRPR
jgi:hypothetical protein